MERFPRTATNIIAAITGLAWILATLSGQTEKVVYALAFIPARIGLVTVPWPAAPAFLTPLTATLVHSGLVHLEFNLLMLVWCGAQVSGYWARRAW